MQQARSIYYAFLLMILDVCLPEVEKKQVTPLAMCVQMPFATRKRTTLPALSSGCGSFFCVFFCCSCCCARQLFYNRAPTMPLYRESERDLARHKHKAPFCVCEKVWKCGVAPKGISSTDISSDACLILQPCSTYFHMCFSHERQTIACQRGVHPCQAQRVMVRRAT